MSFMTLAMIFSGEEYGQSAIIPLILDLSRIEEAIRTVAAPIEMPKR